MQFIYFAKIEITKFRVNFVFDKMFVTSYKIQPFRNVKEVDAACCFKSWLKLTIISCTYIIILRGGALPSLFPCSDWWKFPALLQSTLVSDTREQ